MFDGMSSPSTCKTRGTAWWSGHRGILTRHRRLQEPSRARGAGPDQPVQLCLAPHRRHGWGAARSRPRNAPRVRSNRRVCQRRHPNVPTPPSYPFPPRNGSPPCPRLVFAIVPPITSPTSDPFLTPARSAGSGTCAGLKTPFRTSSSCGAGTAAGASTCAAVCSTSRRARLHPTSSNPSCRHRRRLEPKVNDSRSPRAACAPRTRVGSIT
jgi:hypothetical protein